MFIWRLHTHKFLRFGPGTTYNVRAWTARGAIKRAKQYWPSGFDPRVVSGVTYSLAGFSLRPH